VITPAGGLASATSGIAVGPDGNLWVAEQYAGSVAKVSPTGAVLKHIPVVGSPLDVAAGPGNTVWVTVQGPDKVVKIDTVAGAVQQDIPTSPASACAPAAIVDGGDGRMYVSLPCGGSSKITSIAASTGVLDSGQTGRGEVFDLAVSGGKLFAPDYGGDVVRRMALGTALTVESTVATDVGAAPEGIAVVGSMAYVSYNGSGRIGRFPVAQNGGTAPALPGSPPLTAPFGVAPNQFGGVLVANKDSGNLAQVDAEGHVTLLTTLPQGAEPFSAVTTASGDIWVTDQVAARIFRVVDGPPSGGIGKAAATSGATAAVDLSVDPRGNITEVQVEYGTTTGYGKSATLSVPSGTEPVATAVELKKLKQGKTYHLRLVATNARGTYVGPDVVLKMPKFAKGKPAFKSKVSKAGTELTSVKITKLAAGEKVTLSCSGKGCPLKKKAYKIKKKGTLDLTALFRGKVLKPGAKVVVKLSAKKVAASTTTLTVQPGKAPVVTLG
jgi:streptogramin lyase